MNLISYQLKDTPVNIVLQNLAEDLDNQYNDRNYQNLDTGYVHLPKRVIILDLRRPMCLSLRVMPNTDIKSAITSFTQKMGLIEK